MTGTYTEWFMGDHKGAGSPAPPTGNEPGHLNRMDSPVVHGPSSGADPTCDKLVRIWAPGGARLNLGSGRSVLMRITVTATAIVATVCLLAACGGNSHPAAQPSSAAPTLSYSQGAKICNDLNGWIPPALNQDMPRFDAGLTADENLAVNDKSALGNDLLTEDNDLQADNSLALNPSVLYNQQGVSNTTALSSDCSGYGVILNWQPDLPTG